MEKIEGILEGMTKPDEQIIIRVVSVTEGLAFCSISVGGGAIVSRPGETIVFQFDPIVSQVQVPYQNQPIAGQYGNQIYSTQGYYLQSTVCGHNVTVRKITTLPDKDV